MADILQLPDELLLQVQSNFYLADLEQFNLVCRRFAAVSYRRCKQHRALRRKYRRLDVLDEKLGWFDHLVAVLHNDDVAHYIEELHIPTAEWYWQELRAFDPSVLPSEADLNLVLETARQSKWISEKDACGRRGAARNMREFLVEIEEGDQDNILAVLVPLLPNLRKIELPAMRFGGLKMGSLPGVVERIARAAHTAEQFPLHDDLPLASLREIVGLNLKSNPIARLGFGVDFRGLAPFLAIPSVRKLWTLETHEPMFHWPLDLPKSRVEEVHFLESSISEQAARELGRAIEGPCVMKQDFLMHTHRRHLQSTGPREHWTNIEIPYEGAPEQDWTITRFGFVQELAPPPHTLTIDPGPLHRNES
ncbi:MAG: hypothetical protein M1828_001312 [Chrysothrix sp. TS-e1954]|nr:MAG: hypothetical protein M1828_001312 [Chrysothrix sp. TS-e1954]